MIKVEYLGNGYTHNIDHFFYNPSTCKAVTALNHVKSEEKKERITEENYMYLDLKDLIREGKIS